MSNPVREPRSVAVTLRRRATWFGERFGRAAITRAATAATIGAEKLVPAAVQKPSARPSPESTATGHATPMPSPGAARSVLTLWWLNPVGWSNAFSAATVDDVEVVPRLDPRSSC